MSGKRNAAADLGTLQDYGNLELMKWLAVFALSLAASGGGISVLVEEAGAVRSGSVALMGLGTSNQYSILYSLRSLRDLTAETRVEVEVRQGNALLASKTLHQGDPDYYTQFRVPHAGSATVTIRATHASGDYLLQVNRWPLSPQVKSEPDHRWEDAQTIP
jgi:hypothetical protein